MKTTVEPLEDNKVKLSVVIDENEFEKAIDAAFRKIANDIRLPGFRPGKAPRRLIEARVGAQAARQQALQDGLPDFYVRAIVDNDVDVIAPPELNITAGEESGPVAFEATVEVRPKVRVPGYEGLQVTIPNPVVAGEEVDAQIDRMRNAFATITEVDRQAHPGDHVRIDIAGTIEGEPVPGLTADDYLYEVGVKAVVPELDDAVTGAGAGEIIEFTAAVPGTEGVEPSERISFRINVKAVNEKVLPEADDAWAAGASEFATMEALRSDIGNRMGMVKKVQANMQIRDEALKALTDLVIEDAPDPLINAEIQRRLEDMSHRLSHQNATIQGYLDATGQTQQMLIDEFKEQASQAVKTDLALRAVADAEAVEVTEEDIDAEIVRLAERFKMKPKDARRQLEKTNQMPMLRADVRKGKALTWLMERVQIVDEEGKTVDRSAIELSDAERAEVDVEEIEDQLAADDHDGNDHDDHAGHDH